MNIEQGIILVKVIGTLGLALCVAFILVRKIKSKTKEKYLNEAIKSIGDKKYIIEGKPYVLNDEIKKEESLNSGDPLPNPKPSHKPSNGSVHNKRK